MKMPLLKRDFTLLIKGILPALLLTCLLVLVSGLAGFSAFRAADDLTAPAAVALVDEENSFSSRVITGIVENADFTRELVALERCSKEEALSGISEGRFAAAIILPKEYTDSIMHGQSCKGTVVLSQKAAGTSELVRRASEIAERMIAAGQYGVFAGERLIRSGASLTDGDYERYLALSNTQLIGLCLGMQSDAFDIVLMPYSGFGTDTVSHFTLCWSCFLISLSGMFFPALYTTDRGEDIRSRLKSCGVRTCSFISGKIIWPFVFRCLLWSLVLICSNQFSSAEFSPSSVLCGITGLLLCTCFTSGLALAFPKGAPWIVLLTSCAGLFFCGAIVPLQYLPASFFELGRLLPFGALCGAVSPAFGGYYSIFSVLLCAMWAGAAIACALAFLSLWHGSEVGE